MKEAEVTSLFEKSSVPSPWLKSLVIRASNVSAVVSLRSRSKLTCSVTLYAKARTPISEVRNILRSTSFSVSLTLFSMSIVTDSFTASFTSHVMTSSYFSQGLSERRLSCSIFASSSAGATTFLNHTWLSSFSAISHANIGTSPFAFLLAIWNSGSSRCIMQVQGPSLMGSRQNASLSRGSSFISTLVNFRIRLWSMISLYRYNFGSGVQCKARTFR